ncbi:hypothetical protein J6590_045772 [Homalodisca vitripennis]|nr:hypothetical protein J6590_045772 [Homalodisca vitripennis]
MSEKTMYIKVGRNGDSYGEVITPEIVYSCLNPKQFSVWYTSCDGPSFPHSDRCRLDARPRRESIIYSISSLKKENWCYSVERNRGTRPPTNITHPLLNSAPVVIRSNISPRIIGFSPLIVGKLVLLCRDARPPPNITRPLINSAPSDIRINVSPRIIGFSPLIEGKLVLLCREEQRYSIAD